MSDNPSDPYLAVLKASYDYDPQSDDEISIKEDQILFLLERTDEDWWKVKVKAQDDSGPSGLVPAAYVEQAEHSSIVKALYDYEASASGELTIQEDEILLAFDGEDDWLLVQSTKDGGKAGLVPANYVEPHSEEEDTSASPQIVVPPPPPPVASTYVDPAERVSNNKVNTADDIKTWSISELDKKGKKTKGTLGIGNGAVFFASETSKAAVQKWQTSDINNMTIEKSKHVRFDVGGATPTSLHFHAGSKDNAEAILQKLQSSKALSLANSSPSEPEEPKAKPPAIEVSKKATVHFSPKSPDIIPPRSPSPDEEEQEDYSTANGVDHSDGELAVALYDFTADGEDELTISEGDQLVVIEKDGDEWWKCRNVHGQEGMVPASYVELRADDSAASTTNQAQQEEEEEEEEEEIEDDSAAVAAAAAAEEKAKAERAEKAKAERAEAAEKAAAEAERARVEEERRQREKKKQEATKAAAVAEAERKKRQESRAQSTPPPQSSRSESSKSSDRPSSTSGSGRLNENGRPPADRVRTWHDRTGQFRVDAALLSFKDGKLRLHKTNGVIVEVPSEKMSVEDMKFVEKLMSKKSKPPVDDDNVPLADIKRTQSARRQSQAPKKGPTVDWFEFFLNAGCDIDDCTRYATSFERDKIDEALLPDITESTMRLLGLREGDIIRVTKAIEKRKPQPDKRQEQIARDEEYAKQLQAQENAGSPRGPTNLFTSGPDGSLKDSRRGRPQTSKSLPPSVDLNAIGAASEQIRTGSPAGAKPSSGTPVQPPPRSSSVAVANGFEDDAWTNRPSSAKPLTSTPTAVTPRAPSAPPTTAPAAPAPEPQAQPAPAPAPAVAAATATPPATTGPPSLAKTTEADIFDQLARLEQIRKTTPAQQPTPPVQAQSPPAIVSPPPIAPTPPAGFASGMGMGNSSLSMGQHLQSQQTGVYNGPRGPFAPVPANQALLQPLIPTQTGFNSFIPTRPTSQLSAPSQPSFLNSQPTGFPGQQPMAPQPTGFLGMQQPMMSQPTGMPFGGANGGINPFGSGSSFSPVISNPTGFNPGFGQFNNGMSSPPPVPPLPSNSSNNNNNANPANIFAQMKSGTFATENDNSTPQNADKYNALRTNPLAPQPTGWGTFGQGSYVGGY